ncbi:MAG TPA: serine/threonine-protein kinase [Ktedonobacteraceae bacterium]|nr:serine/threonine-protein kinase [Ktedonobacteraceae bacterium]
MENDAFIGQQLGTYTIQSKLGEGGMARVYKGYHARLKREVAIKVILSQIADKEGFKARFEREAQLIASLQHPNIVAVYDFGEIGHITYLVMQYVGGGTLRDQLRDGRALDPRQAILYCQEMARALHHAHLRGIVHRDVKPQNMLVSATDRNQLLLSDFGIAKLYDNRHEVTMLDTLGGELRNEPSLTSVDQIVGTADYMSPEQINGKAVDARTDVYALGVVLYQMLAGEVPFHSTTIQGLLFQHVYTPPRFICEVNPYVPEILGQITAKAMAKAQEDRYQSAEAMAQALESANQYVTNQLSASLPGNIPTSVQNAPLQSQNPPITSTPSYYNTQSPPAQNGAAVHQQPSHYGMTPPYGSYTRNTSTSNAGLVKPTIKRSRGKTPIIYGVFALVLLFSIGLLLAKQGIIPTPGFTSDQNSGSTTATAFTENFQSTTRNWTAGTIGGLSTGIGNNQYDIQISGGPATYFPHPVIGSLPDTFTLTATMEQTRGSPNAWFGLAFREKDDGNGGNVTCYAFGIQTNGSSTVQKYDPNAANHTITIGGSTNPVPGFKTGNNQFHSIQAVVHGSKFFFKVDNQIVPVSPSPDKSISDSQYSSGHLTLYVSGSNATFIVTSVQLAIP